MHFYKVQHTRRHQQLSAPDPQGFGTIRSLYPKIRVLLRLPSAWPQRSSCRRRLPKVVKAPVPKGDGSGGKAPKRKASDHLLPRQSCTVRWSESTHTLTIEGSVIAADVETVDTGYQEACFSLAGENSDEDTQKQ